MGAYWYKVSTKPVGTLEGKPVYPATYAYKPYWGTGEFRERENARMAFRSGAVSCEAAWGKKKEEDRRNVLVMTKGGDVYLIEYLTGTILDDSPRGFDQKPFATGVVFKGMESRFIGG